jgi:undecaprenyl-diphosphatase
MDPLQALFLGALQGLTEWLPISSSGHLALAQHFFGIAAPVAFDVALHLGTLLAVFVYFWKDIIAIVKHLARKSPEQKLAINIILACIPTAIIGFAFKPQFEAMFGQPLAIALALAITGVILLLAGRKAGKKEITNKSALIVGIAQGIAVAPGISRSGATIGAGLLLGLKRESAALFSFLIAIPAVIGAGAFEVKDAAFAGIDPLTVLLGTAVAAIVGYACIGLLMSVLKRGRLAIFAYYCFGLALLAAVMA